MEAVNMTKRTTLALLRIKPSWGYAPLPTTSLRLVQRGDEYCIEGAKQTGRMREQWKVPVPRIDAENQLEALRKASIPAYPVSPSVCDGSYIELTIYGIDSELKLSWWTAAPDGAEVLGNFSDWLHDIALAAREIECQ